MSKAATEMVVAAWHASFFSKDERSGPLATAPRRQCHRRRRLRRRTASFRTPCALSARSSRSVLRRPQATRPWQHVLESVSGYLALGQRLLAQPARKDASELQFRTRFRSGANVQELMDAWLAGWPGAIDGASGCRSLPMPKRRA